MQNEIELNFMKPTLENKNNQIIISIIHFKLIFFSNTKKSKNSGIIDIDTKVELPS